MNFLGLKLLIEDVRFLLALSEVVLRCAVTKFLCPVLLCFIKFHKRFLHTIRFVVVWVWSHDAFYMVSVCSSVSAKNATRKHPKFIKGDVAMNKPHKISDIKSRTFLIQATFPLALLLLVLSILLRIFDDLMYLRHAGTTLWSYVSCLFTYEINIK